MNIHKSSSTECSKVHAFSTGFSSETGSAVSPPFEYDGFAQFDVADMEAFGKAFADPYWVEVIEADQKNFLDPDAKIIRTMGPLKQIVADRKAIVGVTKESEMLEEYGKK